MFSFIAKAATLALAVSPAFGKIYTTNPVATTTGTGGQTLTVQWADDGESPTLGDIGPCSVDLYTGSVYKQVPLQNLAASVDVSKTAQIMTTIDPHSGQTGNYYFVRFSSLSLKDSTNPQYPYQAYSAKFTLDQMDGTFNATILAAISSDPSASSAAASASATAKVSASSARASSTASRPASTAATSNKANGAASTVVSGTLIAGLVGLSAYIAL